MLIIRGFQISKPSLHSFTIIMQGDLRSSELEDWKAKECEKVRAWPGFDDRRFVQRDGSFMQVKGAARTGDGFLRFGCLVGWHNSSPFLPFRFIKKPPVGDLEILNIHFCHIPSSYL